MMGVFLPRPQPIAIACLGEIWVHVLCTRSHHFPTLAAPCSTQGGGGGVEAGCDVNACILVCSKMTRLRLIKNCNITCDSSGSNEPRWVMFPAILQLLPWSEMAIEICKLYKVEGGHNDENLFFCARSREPVLFWRENAMAVVILQGVLARMS